jgi:hypothetical protein
MAYMNLMYRERADLEYGDPAARGRDVKTGDQWVSEAVKKARRKGRRSK